MEVREDNSEEQGEGPELRLYIRNDKNNKENSYRNVMEK